MKLSEFRQIIKHELQYGIKKVAYMCSINGEIDGGMCFTEVEALSRCKDIFKNCNLKYRDCQFNIVVYGEDVKFYDTHDVVNKIKNEF